jgi:uncharacterized protein YjbI with pentapeptide repeats
MKRKIITQNELDFIIDLSIKNKSKLDLSNLNLTGLHIVCVELKNANFNNTILDDVNFSRVTFTDTDVTKAASMLDCKFSHVYYNNNNHAMCVA